MSARSAGWCGAAGGIAQEYGRKEVLCSSSDMIKGGNGEKEMSVCVWVCVLCCPHSSGVRLMLRKWAAQDVAVL